MAKKEEKKESWLGKILKRKKLLAVVIIIVAAFFGWRYYASRNGKDLKTAEIKKGKVVEELILSGEIAADEYTSLSFSTSGKIIWVGVSEGDWVKKGQALAKIDTTSLNAMYQRALSDLRSADASVERTHDDVKDHDGDETYVQKEMRTAAEVAKDKAWEMVKIAGEDLKNATLLAPFEGLVTYVAHPFSGLNILYSTIQFELLNPETIYFDVSADQSEVIDIHKDQKISVVLDSYSETDLDGEILFISMTPKSGEAGSVYKVKVKFKNNDMDTDQFRIGMTGDAKFVLSERNNILYIPPEFINSDAKGKYINLSSKNNKVYVEVGLEGEERVEISGEINEGDIVFD